MNGPAETDDGSNETTADTTVPEATTAGESMTTEGGDAGTVQGLTYDWTEGESYTFESMSAQDETSTISWTVTDVSDGEVTAEIVSSSPQREENRTSTFTGPQGAIVSGDSQSLQAITFVVLPGPQQLVEGRDLTVGNSWTVSSDELGGSGGQTATPQEITVEVTGISEVAGTECFDIEATSDANEQTLNACVKEDWPYALSFSTSDGSSAGDNIELIDYERP
jgi:hypothetical protein